ncbi:hypothetical protein [Peribacillus sp.]|uniref:hypothetical protein n=1 Tax=Peribacillus sp. TaxID=2675267 RepID=UPI00388F1565
MLSKQEKLPHHLAEAFNMRKKTHQKAGREYPQPAHMLSKETYKSITYIDNVSGQADV